MVCLLTKKCCDERQQDNHYRLKAVLFTTLAAKGVNM